MNRFWLFFCYGNSLGFVYSNDDVVVIYANFVWWNWEWKINRCQLHVMIKFTMFIYFVFIKVSLKI